MTTTQPAPGVIPYKAIGLPDVIGALLVLRMMSMRMQSAAITEGAGVATSTPSMPLVS
jgi:hypothetical protein